MTRPEDRPWAKDNPTGQLFPVFGLNDAIPYLGTVVRLTIPGPVNSGAGTMGVGRLIGVQTGPGVAPVGGLTLVFDGWTYPVTGVALGNGVTLTPVGP